MQTNKEYAIQLAMEYGFTGGFDAQGDLTYDSEFVEAILEAIAKEREACAKELEEYAKRHRNLHVKGMTDLDHCVVYTLETNAYLLRTRFYENHAIRARGEAI